MSKQTNVDEAQKFDRIQLDGAYNDFCRKRGGLGNWESYVGGYEAGFDAGRSCPAWVDIRGESDLPKEKGGYYARLNDDTYFITNEKFRIGSNIHNAEINAQDSFRCKRDCLRYIADHIEIKDVLSQNQIRLTLAERQQFSLSIGY